MFINNVTIALTNACNLRCTYCFQHEKNNARLTRSTVKRAADWLLDDNVSGLAGVFVAFFGGEPLLEFETLKYAVKYFRQKATERRKSVAFGITTNGTLVDARISRYLKHNDFVTMISLDGAKKTHDSFRRSANGKGTYDLVSKNLHFAMSNEAPNIVRMTISPTTAGNFCTDFVHILRLGFDRVYFYCDPYAAWSRESVVRLETSIMEVANVYVDLIEKHEDVIVVPFEKRLVTYFGGKAKRYADQGVCRAGVSHVGISVAGDIYPCHQFAALDSHKGVYRLGDVFSGVEESRRTLFYRLKKRHCLGCDISCDACALKNGCDGGCPAINYEINGHVGINTNLTRYYHIIMNRAVESIARYFETNTSETFNTRFCLKDAETNKNQPC